MRLGLKRLARLSALLCASSCLSGVAYAQALPIPPEHYETDARGVDVITGKIITTSTDLVIGQPGKGGIAYSRTNYSAGYADGWRDNLSGTLNYSGSNYMVSIGNMTVRFVKSGNTFTPTTMGGVTLTLVNDVYTFTAPDGTKAVFQRNWTRQNSPANLSNEALLLTLTKPNGETLTYGYQTVEEACYHWDGGGCIESETIARLRTVDSNHGYQVFYEYASDDFGYDYTPAWKTVRKVSARNTRIDSCESFEGSCTQNRQDWPSITYERNGFNYTATDHTGAQTLYTVSSFAAGGTRSVQRPGQAATTFTLDNTGRVTSLTNATGAWNYAYSDAGTTRTTTVTGPMSHQDTYTSNLSIGRLTSVNDSLNRTTSYEYDTSGRVTKSTNPEGDYAQFTYDVRGNVTQVRQVAKVGSGLADVVTSAAYPASCSNVVTCNQPTSTTDALGKVTDYTYDSTHGGLLTVTLPAGADGARPQTRYIYTQQTAWAGMAPVYKLFSVASCVAGSSCAASGEVKQTIAYGVPGVAGNLLPTVISSGSGEGALWASSSMTYDDLGNLLTVDGPLAGSADTTRYRYDAARRVVGVVGPHPGGALKHAATRTTYDAAGRPALTETGTVNSQSDADWAAFAPAQARATSYDAWGRAIKAMVSGGGTTFAVNQVSYDSVGRINCSVVRMNPAAFGSAPASACTLGAEGADGPDRISTYVYDAGDQLLETWEAVGTGAQARSARYEYTANGQIRFVVDANSNTTQIDYDGFDRVKRTYFPVQAVGALAANGGDYEELTYDAAGRVTQRRLRDGQMMGYGYDDNGNLTSHTRPGGWPGRSYVYDNLGRATSISAPGYSIGLTYDALGRVITQSEPRGPMSYQYDLAGNRTRVTWPDGFYTTYEYSPTGAMTGVKENGASYLVTFGYDDLGRRRYISRGNGAVTWYDYDAASRLNYLSHDLAGTAQDQTYTYGYNAAGQITSRNASNDAYRYVGGAAGTKGYGVNGLNQYTAVGGVTHSYDANGNLQSDGVTTFGHDPDNQFWATSSGADLSRDPAGRIVRAQGPGGGAATDFLYDGVSLAAEYSVSGGMLRRYIPGPGMDEPLMWYEGAGTGDRRWYAADERGSVVGVLNVAGAAQAINTYDEYGVPGAGNLGRYQYTGQTWLPEAGVYNYKARTYSPSLGRFMQTDPVGYADGINWQAYVGNDPINFIDPFGLQVLPDPVGEVIVTGKKNEETKGCGIDRECISGEDLLLLGGVELVEVEGVDVTGGGRKSSTLGGLPQGSFYRIAGGVWDSGLPRDVETLKKMLEDAKKAKNTQLQRRIIKQLKAAGARNSQKLRGLGKFRMGPPVLFDPVLFKALMCGAPGNTVDCGTDA